MWSCVYVSSDEYSLPAAELLEQELSKRTLCVVSDRASKGSLNVRLLISDSVRGDDYLIDLEGDRLTLQAGCFRGLVYAVGLFLRRSVCRQQGITLVGDIGGLHHPFMKIRGHQLGYRDLNNTYDAWDVGQYRHYMLDTMLFGANMCEFIPIAQQGRLMKLPPEEMLKKSIEQAKDLGLDVSLWWPNDELPCEESAKKKRELISTLPPVDVVFVPGGDPGDYPAAECLERCRVLARELSEISPAEVWVSAQAPHGMASWGDDFIKELEKLPEEIKGVIMGPNHAMPLEELRRRVPGKYPIRFYPDVTHNVRCEYPVHHQRDDWHFSLAAINGRESVNPRPTEYTCLHRKTAPYLVGSCSYSEGVNDDVNKLLWTALDVDPTISTREFLCDYSRLFFPEAEADLVADTILMLEDNWNRDSAENPVIEATYERLEALLNEHTELEDNWRFNSLRFRACCDLISRRRRLFELELIEEARVLVNRGKLREAEKLLSTAFPRDYLWLRKEAEDIAQLLFEQIGIQLSVEKFFACSWERGAVLECIDLPITNRPWLRERLSHALTLPENEAVDYMKACLERFEKKPGEVYFSVAQDGVSALGVPQKREVYLNFRGDVPSENNGRLPMSLISFFDSWSLTASFGGLEDRDYSLYVTYKDDKRRAVQHHRVTVNGELLYDGEGYGGERDESLYSALLPEGYVAVKYQLKGELIKNGCVLLEITEPTVGFELCEIRIKRD